MPDHITNRSSVGSVRRTRCPAPIALSHAEAARVTSPGSGRAGSSSNPWR